MRAQHGSRTFSAVALLGLSVAVGPALATSAAQDNARPAEAGAVSVQGCLTRQLGPSGQRQFVLYDVSAASGRETVGTSGYTPGSGEVADAATPQWLELNVVSRGQAAPLDDHVGHQVEISGLVTADQSEHATQAATLEAARIRRVAGECRSAR